MSYNTANTTIAIPGPNWGILWGSGTGYKNFQLDIVGFLAVLGESSVIANAQVSALSRLFYLPRLLPAPQALLPPSRPTELPSTKAWVTAVHTGNYKEHVHHVANILLGEDLPPYTVRCVEVTKPPEQLKRATQIDILFRGVQREHQGQDARVAEMVSPSVKAKASGPLTFVTLTGFFLSVALLIISIVLGDGYSMLATILLSFLSTLIGIANKWNLKLAKRPVTGRDPDSGQTVIRYPNGSFLVVNCTDDIARELYFAPEEIAYDLESVAYYRIISLIGTLFLMLGIIFLANSRLQLQLAWAGAFGIINTAHWAAAAVSPASHWDLSCYTIKEQSVDGGPSNRFFTEALWKAILLTKSSQWVRTGAAAPHTPQWDEWLREAEYVAKQAGSMTAPLQDPIPGWSEHAPIKGGAKIGVVWRQPRNWDPREAYTRIDNKFKQKNNFDEKPPHLQTVEVVAKPSEAEEN